MIKNITNEREINHYIMDSVSELSSVSIHPVLGSIADVVQTGDQYIYSTTGWVKLTGDS